MRVHCYWNIHKGCWSIRDAKTRRVISHSQILELTDCKFHVSEAGRQRVLKSGHKNVHAWCDAILAPDLTKGWKGSQVKRVRYNPKTQATFTCEGVPIFEANRVRLTSDRTVLIKPRG